MFCLIRWIYAENSYFDIDKIIVKFEDEGVVEENDDQLDLNSSKGG